MATKSKPSAESNKGDTMTLPTSYELSMRQGQIYALCPKCGKPVWFDCLDKIFRDEFIKYKKVCIHCKRKINGTSTTNKRSVQ